MLTAFHTNRCFALVQTKGLEISANLICFHAGRLGGGYLLSVDFILYSLMVGTVSTDAVTSVERQADTENIQERKGAAVSNSSECLHTIGRLLGAFKVKLQNVSLCVMAE